MTETQTMKVPAPKPLKWRGKVMVASPLGLGMMFEHANYCRMLYLDDAKKQVAGLPQSIQMEAWKDAKAFADRMVPGSIEYATVANWLDAQIYLCFLSFREKQPELSIDQMRQAMEEQYPDIMELANEMAGFAADKEGASPLAQAATAA